MIKKNILSDDIALIVYDSIKSKWIKFAGYLYRYIGTLLKHEVLHSGSFSLPFCHCSYMHCSCGHGESIPFRPGGDSLKPGLLQPSCHFAKPLHMVQYQRCQVGRCWTGVEDPQSYNGSFWQLLLPNADWRRKATLKCSGNRCAVWVKCNSETNLHHI